MQSLVVVLVAFLAIINPAVADQSVTYLGLDDLNLNAKKENSYEWRIKLGASSWNEGTNKSVGFVTKLQTKLNFQINKKFNIKLNGGVSFYSDNSQYSLTDYGSGDFIFADEASLNFSVFESLIVSGGVFNQSILNAPLLISKKRSFPGLRQELSIRKEKYEFGLIAQELIPTSEAFNDERTEEEEVPTLYTGTLFAEYNFKNPISNLSSSKLNTHLALSYFKFNDLPSTTADKGGLYGHIGSDVGIGPNSKFLYSFSGYLIEPSVSLVDENNYNLKIGGYWADNIEALQNDRLQNIYLEVDKTFGNYEAGFKVEGFFKDSEASPAVYSSGSYGGNNRKGNVYSAHLEFKKYNFKIMAKYSDLKLISENSVQDNRQAYFLGVETLYVKF